MSTGFPKPHTSDNGMASSCLISNSAKQLVSDARFVLRIANPSKIDALLLLFLGIGEKKRCPEL